MFRRMRCLVGGGGVQDSTRAAAKRVSPASWRVDNAAAAAAAAGEREKGAICFRPPDVMETVHEVAIYIHRFHNLDLFQQGYGGATILAFGHCFFLSKYSRVFVAFFSESMKSSKWFEAKVTFF